MGSFAYLIGNYSVTQNQKEIGHNIISLLNAGGMRCIESVSLFQENIGLLFPIPETDKTVEFHYNLFEDRSWESAYVNASKATFHSEKKGSQQFSDVVKAVYLYMEMVSETACIAMCDGEIISSKVLGWINYVLGTTFKVSYRWQMVWEKIEITRNSKYYEEQNIVEQIINDFGDFPDSAMVMYPDIVSLIYFYKRKEIENFDKETRQKELENNIPEEQRTLSVLSCIEILQNGLINTGLSGKELYDFAMALPADKEVEQACRDRDNPALLFYHFVPKRIYAEIIADLTQCPIENVLEDLKKVNYIFYKKETKDSESILKYCTADYLSISEFHYILNKERDIQLPERQYYFSDDDRIMWWTSKETNDVNFSEELSGWFQALKERYFQLLKQQHANFENPTKTLIELLAHANSFYQHIYADRDMFYEFVENCGKDIRYSIAIYLLKEIIEENKETGKLIELKHYDWDLTDYRITFNKGRLAVKRFLAILANKDLRNHLFQF